MQDVLAILINSNDSNRPYNTRRSDQTVWKRLFIKNFWKLKRIFWMRLFMLIHDEKLVKRSLPRRTRLCMGIYYCISVWITRARWTSDQKRTSVFSFLKLISFKITLFTSDTQLLSVRWPIQFELRGTNRGKVQLKGQIYTISYMFQNIWTKLRGSTWLNEEKYRQNVL